MAAKRLYSPSILIDSVEYKAKARSVSLEPGEYINFDEQEWTFMAEIELGYGAGESHTLLTALENTIVDIVLKPEDGAVAVGNPSATFQIRMPAIAFITSVSRGDRMTISLTEETEAPPILATA
jgi:hypothetical protein